MWNVKNFQRENNRKMISRGQRGRRGELRRRPKVHCPNWPSPSPTNTNTNTITLSYKYKYKLCRRRSYICNNQTNWNQSKHEQWLCSKLCVYHTVSDSDFVFKLFSLTGHSSYFPVCVWLELSRYWPCWSWPPPRPPWTFSEKLPFLCKRQVGKTLLWCVISLYGIMGGLEKHV